jgi:hypothetical protein
MGVLTRRVRPSPLIIGSGLPPGNRSSLPFQGQPLVGVLQAPDIS